METRFPNFRNEKYQWFKNRISLDLMSIDEELCEISVLIQEAGEIVAEAIEIREAAKNEFESSIAQIAENLRKSPLASGKNRSESTIASQIPLSKEYDERQQGLSSARLDVALWQTLLEALRTKSSAIRTAADLIVAGYLSTNTIMEKRRREIRDVQPKVAT